MKLEAKKIVLINQSAGYLFIDIANEFVLKYDEVVLITGGVNQIEQPLDPKIKIVRIKKYIKKSTFTRMISWFIAFLQISCLIKLRFRKYHLLISSNPPLATLLPLFCSNQTTLLIYDIYPDGLIAGKFLSRNNLIIKIWRKLNKIAYKKTNQIITLTNGMSDLISQYVDQSKITVIPAWSNKTFDSKDNELIVNKFTEKYGLQNKFLVIYSGNLGKEYELEVLIYLARLMADNQIVRFLIVGEGWQRDQMGLLINELNLNNCQLLPMQTTEMFMDMMESMNLGVVSLGQAVSKIAIPSKTYNILANGKPLLCIGSKDSDLAKMIANHRLGATFQSNEIQAIAEFIEQLSDGENLAYKSVCEQAKKTSLLFTSENARRIVELVTF